MSNAVAKDYDVFISYKSQEREEAYHIKRFLEANGLTCWMDVEKIRISENYKVIITSIMAKCRGMILLLSYSSQQSIEVRNEFLWARESGLDIYPLKIKRCKLNPEYEEWLRTTQTALFYWKSERMKQRDLRTIRDLIYQRKGEPVKTEEEFRNQRIAYYKKCLRPLMDENLRKMAKLSLG